MMDLITAVIYIAIYLSLVMTSFYVLSFIGERRKEKPLFKDNELPKVSVIIPAYNEEETIAKTIGSILESDYPKDRFEVIVVDDGSKDKTYEIAKKYSSSRVKVFTKKNGGKGAALNYGLSKASGEIIFTMDADTHVAKESLKEMTRFFKDEKVASVTPAIFISKPKSLWQRIQHAEFLLGIFQRKVFASLNAIIAASGAFSAYRKSFFDKYGGYDESNITEDLEMSLRIQYNGYTIENCPDAPVYTQGPKTFRSLLIQRRRWYYGLIKNTIKYRKLFGHKYGDLGLFVFPAIWFSNFLAILVTTLVLIQAISKIANQIAFLNSVRFSVINIIHINWLTVEGYIFQSVTNPIIIASIIFILLLSFYAYYAKRKAKSLPGLIVNIPIFFALFSILYAFWWVVSIFYSIFYRKISWR